MDMIRSQPAGSLLWFAMVVAMIPGPALAEDQGEDDEAEITIRLMETADAELPAAVTEQIELPPAATEDREAVENAQRGIERANENRDRREEGQATADEARERGAEMSEEARENVENRGRSEENPPDPPNRPDTRVASSGMSKPDTTLVQR